LAGGGGRLVVVVGYNRDVDTKDAKQRMQECLAGWEMVERAQAQELMDMTDERALEILAELGDVESEWKPDGQVSGLVEQQAIFKRWKRP
jgi:hypothetical protein